MLLLSATVAGVAAAGLAHGTFHRNSPLFGRPITRAPGDGLVVALTFDDGPNAEATPRILDALAREEVAGTFFVLGRHADRWPALVARAAAEGHAIANHGWHHRKLHRRTPGWVRADLERGTASIVAAGGGRPTLFRAPHGFRSPWVTPIAHSLGQATVGWSLGVWDSARPGVEAIVRRTVHGVRPGSIVLLHDGDGYDPVGDRLQTAAALPLIIRALRDRGYRFVSLGAA